VRRRRAEHSHNARVSADAPCRIVLVGMMGSGKSTIGGLLAEATGWRYVDNDDLVVRATGMSSRELVRTRGEAPMREAERTAAEDALAEVPPVVVGIAGGAIADEAVQRTLAHAGLVVWLRAGTSTLAERAFGADHRPWLNDGGVAWIDATNAERASLYASVADLAVDTDLLGPTDAVGRILAAIAMQKACAPPGSR